jgi:dTDP-4-dehydrorhamnose reductase
MTVVILGKGFIGTHFRDVLLRTYPDVHSFDSRTCDLLDPLQLAGVLHQYKKIDALVITAGLTRLRANDRQALAANMAMVANTLDCAE